VSAATSPEATNLVEGKVRTRSFRGDRCHVVVQHNEAGDLALSFGGGDRVPPPGTAVRLSLDPRAITLLRNG